MSANNELLFGEEPDNSSLVKLPDRQDGKEYLVLVVDDDEYVHQLTKMVLRGFSFEGAPIRLVSAMSAKEAMDYLITHSNVAAALVDVVMETDHAGLDLVNYVRNECNNNEIRLIVRTGQPGAAPEESVFKDYDINDYLSKTELTAHKLRMALLNALRSYRDIRHAADLQKQIMLAEQDSKASAAASEAKSKFLAHMSHEIRTPLNGIIGIADLLSQGQMEESQSQYVKTIQNSGEALLAIINDILDFSKIEAGKLELENTDFCLSDLGQSLNGLFIAQLKDKNLDYKFSVDPMLPEFLKGDPLRLKQILINLVGNSIKFTESGGIFITVKALEFSPNLRIQFTVTDTGIGIPNDKLPTLFEAFTQVDSSTTRKYGGTGLGLQISKSLVELMQGTIFAQSQYGKGSSFIFDIVLKSGKLPKESEIKIATSYNSVSDVRILVAEDNKTNQLVISAMLKKLGYSFDIINNGKEAIESLKKSKYDLILMDCQMPILDGFEATSEIRMRSQWVNLPIIALTAGATKAEKTECIKVGMNDFLSKPITIDVLETTLRKWH
ncbi:MAG: signal transduction histidine kinase [Crocinitomicaceae bacterium]|jgi:signal transduction histidine kinase